MASPYPPISLMDSPDPLIFSSTRTSRRIFVDLTQSQFQVWDGFDGFWLEMDLRWVWWVFILDGYKSKKWVWWGFDSINLGWVNPFINASQDELSFDLNICSQIADLGLGLLIQAWVCRWSQPGRGFVSISAWWWSRGCDWRKRWGEKKKKKKKMLWGKRKKIKII